MQRVIYVFRRYNDFSQRTVRTTRRKGNMVADCPPSDKGLARTLRRRNVFPDAVSRLPRLPDWLTRQAPKSKSVYENENLMSLLSVLGPFYYSQVRMVCLSKSYC